MKSKLNVFKGISICIAVAVMFYSLSISSIIDVHSESLSSKVSDNYIAPVEDPDASAIKITTAEELSAIQNNMYGSYVLMNDIDLSGYGDWTPIGTNLNNAFHGKLDGQGHKITGLTVRSNFNSGTILAPTYSVGLFGVCDGAQIKNITIENADVSVITSSGYRYNSNLDSDYSVYAGIISGYITNDTIIYNCNTSGNVLAKAYEEGYSDAIAGGIVGEANKSIISFCHNASDVQAYNQNAVQAYDSFAGGIVGCDQNEVIIDRTYNSGSVTALTGDYGNAYAGGLTAGSDTASIKITNCYNEGTVQAQSGNMFADDSYAGGISAIFSGSIDKVYNSGSVTAYAKDTYGINSTKAYSGGICGKSTSSSTIDNAAIVQASVAASASSSKYQYRISYGGDKHNTITINSVAVGSTNDANEIKTLDDMQSADAYIEIMNWDFNQVWEFVSGKPFPQLKKVDTNSEEYVDEYITQHLNFINSSEYSNLFDEYRWAQIYWSQENNFSSNLAGALYDGIDKAVNLATLNFGDLFDDGNPFKIILADYISDQTVEEEVNHLYKVTVPYELDKKYKKVKSFVKENWEDVWGELSDEDIFYLFHYSEKTSDEWVNNDFEKHISEIIYAEKHNGDTLESVLGVTTETLDTILKQKEHLDNTIEWFNGLIDYSAQVNAYVSVNDNFKAVLKRMCDNLPEETAQEKTYKSQLKEALESYTRYNDSDDIVASAFSYYISESVQDGFESIIQKELKKGVKNWVKNTFSSKAQAKLNAISWSAEKAWKITDYITKNGEIQECREMLRANAYFESAMYNTLVSIENDFKSTQTIENARLFDTAFKFFKETEIYSMDTCISYMDTYQTSWVQAIRNRSNTFMNSAIEEVLINKLYLYNLYCHGFSYELGGKIITVACPTSVNIYNDSGELVVSADNNAVNECSGTIAAYVADNIKIIALPLDQNYSIKIDACEDGTMDYVVSEYNSNYENVQMTVYSDIEIEKGTSYYGNINNELITSPETYNLTYDNENTIDSHKTVTAETNIPVENIEINCRSTEINVGESIDLSAYIYPENATIQTVVWSSLNPEIANVSEKGKITALSKGEVTIVAQSIYGGISDEITLKVNDNSIQKVSLEGKLITFGDDENTITTVILIANDSPTRSYQTQIPGTGKKSYSFTNVESGDYMLTVSKENHAARTYEISVGNDGVTLDLEIHLLGDVNGDGKITVSDVAKVNSHIKGKSTLTDYDFAVADVNGDDKLTVSDTAKINAHMRGKSSLWK